MFADFLTNAMLVAGFGALLDNVFIDKKERERISHYLESGVKDISLNDRFSEFLKHAHSVVFNRFFSYSLFSFGFLRSAAIISLISFSIVIGVQALLFPEIFSEIQFNDIQIVIFLMFILFNILFDYATIIQTKVFIESSLSANSIFKSTLFIFSDIVVTMNTFILCYALFILIVVQIFVAEPKSATILLSNSENASEIELKDQSGLLEEFKDSEFAKKIRIGGYFSGELVTQAEADGLEKVTIFYYSSFDPNKAELQAAILTSLTTLNISNVGFSKVTDQQTLSKYEDTLFGTKSEPGLSMKINAENREIYALKFSVDWAVSNLASLDGAYASAFALTDKLEDEFPASLIDTMELPRLDSLIESVVATPYPGHPIAICFKNNTAVSRTLITKSTLDQLSYCEDIIAVEFFWANSYDKDLALVGRETRDYRVPFNTLLITSLLPTAFFYLSITLLAIAVVFFSKVIIGTNKIKKFFLRAPLSISGLILGSLLNFLGLM